MRRIVQSIGLSIGCFLLAFGPALSGPLTDKGTQPNLTYPLLPPSDCANCHGDFDTLNVEPVPTWEGSMMANSSRDPLFWAALDVANHDVPGVGDWCLRCHAPHGWLAGRSEPPGGTVDGCGLVGKIDEVDNDFDGVSCHFCHRMMDNATPPPGEESFYYENGSVWLDDTDCDGGGQPCRRGPYDYPADGANPPPQGGGGHPWMYSQLHDDTLICATCHNVTSPVNNLIQGGVDTGIKMPIERTFKEWQQSDFSVPGPGFTTCGNCHMRDATEDPVYACRQLNNNHTGDLPTHQLAGGNAWIPDVLRQEYPALDRDAGFTATRDWALDQLQNHSATVEITVPGQAVAGQDLEVSVKVTNLTGHKLPTGYPEGRRMWLNVVTRDGDDAVIWESGAYDAGTGHLNEDAAIKIYEVELGVWDFNGDGSCDIADSLSNPIFHFVLNDCIVSDNRIPPAGFTGATDLETAPVAYTYPETSPGSGILVNYDETAYTIPIPPGAVSPVEVEARLYYQTASKEYVEFLRDEAVDHSFPDDCIERSWGFPDQSRGELLYEMWETYGKSPPVEMSAAADAAVVLGPTPGEASGSTEMLVMSYDSGLDQIGISYDPACAASNHTIYVGELAAVASLTFTDQLCGLDASGSAGFTAGPGNRYWLIVGEDGVHEGSYGKDSTGTERSEDVALGTCNLPQDLSRSCD